VRGGGATEAALTRSDVTGSDRRSHDPEGVPLEGCAYAQPEVAQYPALFSYYSSSTKCSTSTMATGSDVSQVTPKGIPLGGSCSISPAGVPLGARMRNRKLCNIRPSGAFSPEVTSSPIGLPLELEVGGVL